MRLYTIPMTQSDASTCHAYPIVAFPGCFLDRGVKVIAFVNYPVEEMYDASDQ